MSNDCYLKPGGIIVKLVVTDRSVATDNNILPVEGTHPYNSCFSYCLI